MKTIFAKTTLALLSLGLAISAAHARPGAVRSLEYLADTSPRIGVYTVSAAVRQETAAMVSFDLDLKLAHSLKGDAPATATAAKSYYLSRKESTPATDLQAGDRLLVFFSAAEGDAAKLKVSSIILLSKPTVSMELPAQAVNAKSEWLKDEVSILATVRDRIAAHPATDTGYMKSMDRSGVHIGGKESMDFYDLTYLVLPADLRAPVLARQDESAIVDALRQYYAAKHTMPRGGNGDITEALAKQGNDGRWLRLELETRYNKQWELCDPWGTPYRINASNPKFPWAYSCGPDKIDNGGAVGSDDVVSWREDFQFKL